MPVDLDDMYPRCTYRGCNNMAKKRIQPPYGRPWYGCLTHAGDMAEALKHGTGANGHVDVTEVSRAY